MRQGFKRFWLIVVNDSWLCCLLAGYIAGSLFFLPAAAAALILLAFLEPVRSGCSLRAVTRNLTENFYAYRTWGGVWLITQKRPRGHTCQENRQSFLKDIRLNEEACTVISSKVLAGAAKNMRMVMYLYLLIQANGALSVTISLGEINKGLQWQGCANVEAALSQLEIEGYIEKKRRFLRPEVCDKNEYILKIR